MLLGAVGVWERRRRTRGGPEAAHRRGGASDRTSRKRQEGRAPSFWDHCHQNIGGNRNGSFVYYWAPTSASVQCVLLFINIYPVICARASAAECSSVTDFNLEN